MTIFSQKRPKYGEDPNFTPNTVIGEGVTVRGGVIKGSNSVMVSGLVFGDINVDGEVIVTETGYVKGDILSTFAVIAGIVEGNLQLTSYASLKSTASVTGDINCTAINIEDGAVFTGSCNMIVKSGALAKKLKRINEQAAAMESWEPPRTAEPADPEPTSEDALDEQDELADTGLPFGLDFSEDSDFEPSFDPDPDFEPDLTPAADDAPDTDFTADLGINAQPAQEAEWPGADGAPPETPGIILPEADEADDADGNELASLLGVAGDEEEKEEE